MKLLVLKRKARQIVMLLSLTVLSVLGDKLHAVEDTYYPKIEKTLFTCLCDQNDRNSFQYFVDHLVDILKGYTSFLEEHQWRGFPGGISAEVTRGFMCDLQKIRYSKNIAQIGLTLAKWKSFLPDSMKSMSLGRLAGGLKYRLSQSGTTTEVVSV